MGKAIIEKTEKGVSIKCIRGPLSKMKIIVKNKAGEEFYSPMDIDIFNVLPADRPVEVFERVSQKSKKFVKEYLEYVSNTEWSN
jgi:hypothetical protein